MTKDEGRMTNDGDEKRRILVHEESDAAAAEEFQVRPGAMNSRCVGLADDQVAGIRAGDRQGANDERV
jgi:hypothetical protein